MKRLLIFFIMMIVLMSLIYITLNPSNIDVKEISESKKTIVLITKMEGGEYWESVYSGALVAAKEFNLELIFDAPTEEDDYQAQIELLEKYIEEDVDGIVLAASDYEALVPMVEKAYNKGIPLVLIDSAVNTEKYYKSFSTDNYRAGLQAGVEALKLSGDDAKIGIISFVRGSENAIERERGVREILEANPNITILDTSYCMSSIEVAETQAMIFLDKDVDMIIGLNAIASTGMARALDHYKPAIGIGFDSTPEEIMFIDQGIIDAAVVQNPLGMGYLGIKYASGQPEELAYKAKDNVINTFVINSGNIFSESNQKLVFPFEAQIE